MGETKQQQVYDSFFENDNAEKIFFYTGKSNVLGLQHPDHVFYNEDNHRYIKLLSIKAPQNLQNENIYEDLTIMLAQDISYDSISRLITNTTVRPEAISMQISANGLGQKGHIDGFLQYKVSDKLAEYIMVINTEYNIEHKLFKTDQYQTTIDDNNYYAFDIWMDMEIFESAYPYICIYVNKSLSANFAPVNGESFIPPSYITDYLNDSNATIDDLRNEEGEMGNSGIDINDMAYVSNKHQTQIETLLESIIPYNSQSIFVYDPLFTPTKLETVVGPTSRKVDANTLLSTSDLPVIDGKNVLIKKDGYYSIQLKNGFYLIQGETRLDINVYINDTLNEELSLSMYLTSNGEEDARKAIKNTFCSPLINTKLSKDDVVSVRVLCTNTDNLVNENETKLFITFLNNILPEE